MGNKVSSPIRYPYAIQIEDILGRSAETELVIYTTVAELCSQNISHCLDLALAGKAVNTIDYEHYTVIRVKTATKAEFWDVSFDDIRAFKAFVKRVSHNLNAERVQAIKELRDAEEFVKATKALVAIEASRKVREEMPQPPRH